jgi:hypothetical protein
VRGRKYIECLLIEQLLAASPDSFAMRDLG